MTPILTPVWTWPEWLTLLAVAAMFVGLYVALGEDGEGWLW